MYSQLLLAPNAFKGTLSAPEICRILQEELSGGYYPVISIPLGDGGDGTAEILASYFNARQVNTQAEDALGVMHPVTYYTTSGIAIIELAAICGLKYLRPEEYDVENANTAGVGRVINEIVNRGIKEIILCIGGSASIDGGTGALQAMGLKIVKHASRFNNHILDIKEIETDKLIENFKEISFTILCDVENPLLGPQGAVHIFGPQKGASGLQISILERQMKVYVRLLEKITGKDVTTVKHGGAAGGIAAAFSALLNARLVSGADYCIDLSGFKKLLNTSTLVITGEGKLDNQSLSGKIPGTVARLCRSAQADAIAIAGIAEDIPGIFKEIFSLSHYAGSAVTSLLQPEFFLRMAARELKKLYLTF